VLIATPPAPYEVSWIGLPGVFVASAIGVTAFSPSVTYAVCPSGVIAMEKASPADIGVPRVPAGSDTGVTVLSHASVT
jgi:hypothetical protein